MRALVQNYWSLIRGAKQWLGITLGLFSLAFAGAVVVGLAKPSLIQEMVDHLPGGNETGFPAFIFFVKHNVTVMLITWCGSLVLSITSVLNTIGMGFIFGGLSLLATIWSFFYIPELKDRTFDEIDLMFQKRVPPRKMGSFQIESY